jgi:aryl-alcohol dehydrogenase-like predicted oxidoreductase
MRYRRFGRLAWDVSEIGYGMWGMGGWTGSDDNESARALDLAVSRGCNFFDTALAYGEGKSERMLGELLKRHPSTQLYAATKVPPLDRRWPGKASTPADQTFPFHHVLQSAETSLRNMDVDTIDLLQLHVWDDSWTADHGWQRAAEELKQSGRIRAFGISVNRWEPENVLRALDTGLIDAVQVVYNIFDQAPEDVLFPACERLGVAVIARVPFDEGSLTGTLSRTTRWPDHDFRSMYFAPPNLAETLDRVEALTQAVDEWHMTLPEAALKFILAHPAVTTTIPGMRRPQHVEANLRAAGAPLDPAQVERLRAFRWDRLPDARS